MSFFNLLEPVTHGYVTLVLLSIALVLILKVLVLLSTFLVLLCKSTSVTNATFMKHFNSLKIKIIQKY